MVLNQPVIVGNLGAADNANRNGVIFASASRAQDEDPHGLGNGIYVSDEIHNFNARGVDIFVDATSSGSGTVTVKLQKKDLISGDWNDIGGATTAAVGDPGNTFFTVYPGIAETANATISDNLGLIWRVHATVATAAVTFSVAGAYLG